jgi:hypothetical protein
MNIQNQIKRRLSQPVVIQYVAGLLQVNKFVSRRELANFRQRIRDSLYRRCPLSSGLMRKGQVEAADGFIR